MRRTAYGNIRHKLEDLLKNFLELPNGIPDSDTFSRLFERINPKDFSLCLKNWIAAEQEQRAVIAVDIKTIIRKQQQRT